MVHPLIYPQRASWIIYCLFLVPDVPERLRRRVENCVVSNHIALYASDIGEISRIICLRVERVIDM